MANVLVFLSTPRFESSCSSWFSLLRKSNLYWFWCTELVDQRRKIIDGRLKPLLKEQFFVYCKFHVDSHKGDCNMYYLDYTNGELCSLCLAHHKDHLTIQSKSFKECLHPDDKQRNQLSRELGLAPRQIKLTQLNAQHERADNNALKAENDKIRCENIAIREALKHAICPNCGGPPVNACLFQLN